MTKTKKLETIKNQNLVTATGGFGLGFINRHPFMAQAYFDHHPNQEARFDSNHPWMAARLARINGR